MNKQSPITTQDGINLYTTIHDEGHPAWIVASHGIGESSERHDWLEKLFGQDFNIARYDLRGHGQSGGVPAHGTFDLFKNDLETLLLHLVRHHNMKKYILFGHSMGALICADWLQNQTSEELYPLSVFLNAPPVGFPGILGKIVHRIPTSALSKVNGIPLSLKIGGLIDTGNLSHDPQVEKQYYEDPHNHLQLHSKLLLEMILSSRRTFSHPINPRCPAFVTVGSEDKIICTQSLLHYFKFVEKNFHLQIFEGAWHEIHNETKKYRLAYFEFLQTTLKSLVHKEKTKS